MTTVFAGLVARTVEDAAVTAPRAEFRTFGQGIIAELQPRLWNGRTVLHQAQRMPAETHFLSRRTRDAHVTVRDGLLDIKIRIGTTPEGYEIFQPNGNYQFPVAQDPLASIAARLHVQLPESVAFAAAVTYDEFLGMARQHPDLVPILVERTRWEFTIGDVMCEYAQVHFNGALVESASVESDDYAAMRDVIQELGLTSRPNVNYMAAAAFVVGMR